MSREWLDDLKPRPVDKRWVMRCDTIQPSGQRCPTEGAPHIQQPDLAQYAQAGWFIGAVYGDMCPACLAAGLAPSAAPHPAFITDRADYA